MQKSNFLFLLFFVLLFISCKNEEVIRKRPLPPPPALPHYTPPPVNPTDTSSLNTVPNVFAGPDIHMVFPLNWYLLKGSSQYPESNHIVSWKKISGMGYAVIENPSSLQTKVHSLEKGVYVFELSITNKAGLTGKDTVSVTVLEEGAGESELIFKDLQWVCPMGCHMRIENFYSFVPAGTAFKAYVKRDHSAEWIEVLNSSYNWSKYMWAIYNGGLEISEDQTENPEDTPDVKIVF